MPLHRTTKGEQPQKALAELVRRIERAGGTVVQIIDNDDEWLIQSTRPSESEPWEHRA
jgi:hypothetical protein